MKIVGIILLTVVFAVVVGCGGQNWKQNPDGVTVQVSQTGIMMGLLWCGFR